MTGYGACSDRHWYSQSWTTEEEETAKASLKRDSMPWKECYAVARAVATFAPRAQGQRIILHSDCMPVVSAWIKGDSPKPAIAGLIRTILFMCACNDVELRIQFIRGTDNTLADALSRDQITLFKTCLPGHDPSPITCSPLPNQGW